MAEHRVPVLSTTLRRFEDPERSADPRIYRLVSELRALELAPPPRAHFRAELRTQLVAVAPRLITEGVRVELPRPAARAEHRPSPVRRPATAIAVPRPALALARAQNISLGRPLAIMTGMLALFAVLLGGAVWMSKSALPGDALYSLKRANETVQLSLADGPTAKSKDYLSFAGERVNEVADLLQRASAAGVGPTAAGISARTTTLVNSTLGSADTDVRDAAQLLGGQALSSHSAAPLAVLTSWAPGQIAKLNNIAAQLPSGAVQNRIDTSTQLVVAAAARAQKLASVAGCPCMQGAPVDTLGPVPCQLCATPSSAGASPAAHGRSTTHGTPAASSGAPSTGASTGAASSGSSGISSHGLPLPGVTIQLPSLPLHLPSHSGSSTGGASASSTSASPTCILSVFGLCIAL